MTHNDITEAEKADYRKGAALRWWLHYATVFTSTCLLIGYLDPNPPTSDWLLKLFVRALFSIAA